jgi:hypothetical protein
MSCDGKPFKIFLEKVKKEKLRSALFPPASKVVKFCDLTSFVKKRAAS